MEFLINPNMAYLLIVFTALVGMAALIIPGTGLSEMGLAVSATLAGFEIYLLSLNGEIINVWALLLLILSIIPFLLSIRTTKSRRWLLLAATIVLMIGGSAFLFTNENGWSAVDPILAGIVSLISAAFVWIGVERSVEVMRQRPFQDLDTLIGQMGEARSAVHREGSVQVAGELWSARSEKPIQAGSAVRVLRRDGFVLLVEQAK